VTLSDKDREILQTWLDSWVTNERYIMGRPIGTSSADIGSLIDRLELKPPLELMHVCKGKTEVMNIREAEKVIDKAIQDRRKIGPEEAKKLGCTVVSGKITACPHGTPTSQTCKCCTGYFG
jgi:hypothetical protein